MVEAVPWDAEGERILDEIEKAHSLTSEAVQGTRRYGPSTESRGDLIGWFRAVALEIDPQALKHVKFGVPGKNA
jgi:hypothetical protein